MMTEIDIFGWTVSLTGKHSFRGIFIYFFYFFWSRKSYHLTSVIFSAKSSKQKENLVHILLAPAIYI